MHDYNYDAFSSDTYDLDRFVGPPTGTKAPDFELSDSQGNSVRLLDFKREFLVLEMGSITCPLFQSRRGGMSTAIKQFPQVDFSILYVREAHPGKNIPSHTTLDAKRACASRLHTSDGEARTLVIDDLDGTAHQAYGNYPNAVFIINKNGCIVFQSDWNNPNAVITALTELLAGRPASVKSYFRPALPWIALRTLKRGGPGSGTDFLRSLPVLIWKNLIRRNLRLWSSGQNTVQPDAKC